MNIHTMLLHDGMVIAGLPYSLQGQTRMDEVVGGPPCGATTIADGDGSRQDSATELQGARFIGCASLPWNVAAAFTLEDRHRQMTTGPVLLEWCSSVVG